jgi:hypothetical protein
LLEKGGIPSVSIITRPFRVTGKEMAKNWGLPDYRFLEIPHPIANLTEAELDQRAENVFEDVIELIQKGQS